jgi:hypothetical protein
LEERKKFGKSVPLEKTKYHRQYIGFVRNGERFIYGNFYPDSALGHDAKFDETTQPLMVCDGGPAFWGIVYRVSTKTFEEPAFNGRA